MWPFQTISTFQVQFHPVQIKPDCSSIVYVPEYWTWSVLVSPHSPFSFLLTLKHRSRCLVASQQISAAGRQMGVEHDSSCCSYTSVCVLMSQNAQIWSFYIYFIPQKCLHSASSLSSDVAPDKNLSQESILTVASKYDITGSGY